MWRVEEETDPRVYDFKFGIGNFPESSRQLSIFAVFGAAAEGHYSCLKRESDPSTRKVNCHSRPQKVHL